jgi:low temperature requirement protein LtrA
MDTFVSFIGALLILFMFINVAVSLKLFQFAWNSGWKYPALNERAFSALIKTIGSLILGFLGFLRLTGTLLPPDIAVAVLLIAIVLHGFPPIIWLWYCTTGRFNKTINDLELEPNGDNR